MFSERRLRMYSNFHPFTKTFTEHNSLFNMLFDDSSERSECKFLESVSESSNEKGFAISRSLHSLIHFCAEVKCFNVNVFRTPGTVHPAELEQKRFVTPSSVSGYMSDKHTVHTEMESVSILQYCGFSGRSPEPCRRRGKCVGRPYPAKGYHTPRHVTPIPLQGTRRAFRIGHVPNTVCIHTLHAPHAPGACSGHGTCIRRSRKYARPNTPKHCTIHAPRVPGHAPRTGRTVREVNHCIRTVHDTISGYSELRIRNAFAIHSCICERRNHEKTNTHNAA